MSLSQSVSSVPPASSSLSAPVTQANDGLVRASVVDAGVGAGTGSGAVQAPATRLAEAAKPTVDAQPVGMQAYDPAYHVPDTTHPQGVLPVG